MALPIRKVEIFLPCLTKQANWHDRDFDCIASGLGSTRRKLRSETADESKLSLRFWLADFTDGEPSKGDRLTLDGTVYRVKDTLRMEPYLTLVLGNEYSRNTATSPIVSKDPSY